MHAPLPAESGNLAPLSAPNSGARYPGWLLFVMALGGFAIGISEFASMSVLPQMARGLGIDEPTAGHLISAYALGVVIGAPLIAVLSARVPRRTLLVALMAMYALSHVATAMAPDYATMLVARLFSGLPHGAYFGMTSLVAASLVGPGKRAQAVSRVGLGLTIATVVGVPLAAPLGEWLGWRAIFLVVVGLALVTALAIAWLAPRDSVSSTASPLQELQALRSRSVWITLAIGSIGFAGVFSVYAYLASTMDAVTGVGAAELSIVLMLFGVGMTLGNLVGGWLADRALMPAIGGILLWMAVVLALYPLAAGSMWLLAPLMVLVGMGCSLATCLQIRLMDVAGEAQGLAAALNHSAFNTANALGPWLGGLAISAGMGWTSTGWVGSLLALGGLVLWGLALVDDRARRSISGATVAPAAAPPHSAMPFVPLPARALPAAEAPTDLPDSCGAACTAAR